MTDRDKAYLLKELMRTIDESDSTAAFCLCQRWILKDALAMLKTQEPVEPTKPDEDNTVYCGACGAPVGYEVLEPPGMDYIRYNYCPMCGKAVK